jgi:hypothetical protein
MTTEEKTILLMKAASAWTKERDMFLVALRYATTPEQLHKTLNDSKWRDRLEKAGKQLTHDLEVV